MSLAKLLLSGFLVAGGLILGAFTLHGYFDPQWLQRQAQATKPREPAQEPKSINAFQSRSRFVTTPATAQDTAAQPQVVKASARPDAKSAEAADAKAAAARAAARRKLAEKKKAEKEQAEKAEKIAKAKQQPQQATFQWPWNW